jgi:hypothetical protein
LHIDKIERDGGRRRFAVEIEGMADIAMPAEQTQQFLLVLREIAPEQPFQFGLFDHPKPDASQERGVDARVGDEAPALGAGVRCCRTRRPGVAQQRAEAAVNERL